MSDQVELTIHRQVATIVLSRPESMNALNRDLKEALLDTLQRVSSDADVRAVLLTALGPAFCVGQDLNELRSDLNTDPVSTWDTVRDHYSPIVRLLATMPKPVIAAINGIAAGAGAAFALVCDYRIGSSSAGFNFAFASIGLSADSASTWFLPRLVGLSRAKSLLMRPRTINAETALRWGLIDEIVDIDALHEHAHEIASEFASGPTIAYAAIRQALVEAAGSSLERALEVEEAFMRSTGSTVDHRSAVTSFLTKQKAQFSGVR